MPVFDEAKLHEIEDIYSITLRRLKSLCSILQYIQLCKGNTFLTKNTIEFDKYEPMSQ